MHFFRINMLNPLGLPAWMGTLQLPLLPQACLCSLAWLGELHGYIYVRYAGDLQILCFQLPSYEQVGKEVESIFEF